MKRPVNQESERLEVTVRGSFGSPAGGGQGGAVSEQAARARARAERAI